MDLNAVSREIEDVLFPRLELDVWERALYWHLFRHTHLEGAANNGHWPRYSLTEDRRFYDQASRIDPIDGGEGLPDD